MSLDYQKIKNYKSLLLIKEENEMNSIISSTFDDIRNILNKILDRIKTQFIPFKEKNKLLDTLKFIDNLNLFIDDSILDEFSGLMKDISSELKSYKRKKMNKEIRNEIIAQIDFTELTFIKHRKSSYKKLFFKENNQNEIIKEIENDLQKVLENEPYDWELFQQIQNIYWILKNKIENESEKKHLENKIKKIKKKIHKYYYYKNCFSNNGINNPNKKNKKYKGDNIEVEITTYFKSNNKPIIEEDKKEEIRKNEILEKEQNDNPENNYLNGEENKINHRNNIIKDNFNNENINENINDKNININNNEVIINEIIDKNKINANDKKEIKDKTILFEEKIEYRLKYNIYDFYLNIKTLPNNIIISDLNNKNGINPKKNYCFDKNIIEEHYKKTIIEFKKEKLKLIKPEITNQKFIDLDKLKYKDLIKNKKNIDNNIINKLLLKLNIPIIILKALEEIVEEDSLYFNNNKINDININDEIDFKKILKIYTEDNINKYKNHRDFKEKEGLENILLKDYILYTNNYLNNNSQIISKSLNDLIEKYNNEKLDKNISLINFVLSEYQNLNIKNEDFNYLLNKISFLENSSYFSINLELYEKYILLPLYYKTIKNFRDKSENYNYIINKYTKILKNIFSKKDIIEEISPYGSFINNFSDENGDIDLCIVPKIPWFKLESYFYKIKNKIINKNLGKIKRFHKIENFYLISICDKETNINIDITIHNLLPILNSKLIKIYSEYDQRFHIMGIYLKHWSKLNKVHGAAFQYLSSYALIIMLIYFLQNVVKPSILPNLQNIPINDNYNNPEYKYEEYDYYYGKKLMTTNIHFEENIEKIDKYMNHINNGEKNKENVSNLLLKFFEYYAYFHDRNKIISINKNSETCLNTSHNFGFYIEDPFELKHKVGRSMKYNSQKYNEFIDCMKKEANFILEGEYIKRLSENNLK